MQADCPRDEWKLEPQVYFLHLECGMSEFVGLQVYFLHLECGMSEFAGLQVYFLHLEHGMSEFGRL